MSWLQLHLPATKGNAVQIEAALEALGAISITLTDGADDPIFEPPPGATPLWQQTIVTALFEPTTSCKQLLENARQITLLPLDEYHCEQLDDQAWERAWMDDFKPMQFGQRLWVIPSTHQPPDAHAVNLLLDPGLAFGTGTHETTALCLEWIDGCDWSNKTVLDFGCGSGILAIAALLCGAQTAVGTDIDPQALLASEDNAKQNRVNNRLTLFLPDNMPNKPFDVLLANILAAPLIELASLLASHVKPGGDLVLSGILTSQANEVAQAYQPWFTMNPPDVRGDWVRITGKRLP